jgi:uncharacterized membrane protein
LEGREGLLRIAGARELLAAWGLLSFKETTPWVWSRVAGDVMDVMLLASSARQPLRRSRSLGALGVVAAVTAVDVYAGVSAARGPTGQAGARASAGGAANGEIAETILVKKSPEECYRLWRDLTQLPRFMPLLRSVRALDERRSHWVLETPVGMRVEWDAEITRDEPGRRLAWRSSPNAQIAHAGVVRFREATGQRGTFVRVAAQYRLLSGYGGSRQLAKLVEKAPQARQREELRRFKQLLETGVVPTTAGQPHGRRSLLGTTLQHWSQI